MDGHQVGTAPRYRAFVSYSHADKRVARRVQRALEAFRVPADVEIEDLSKGRRLGRIFRDDDDLAASGALTGAIRAAIEDSRNLIVICSPNSALSEWVNAEIDLFRALHGSRHIYALIIDGAPNALDPAKECFPKALVPNKDEEPLAPDLRQDGMGRAMNRLVAGMLGLSFDDLWQRTERAAKKQRRRRNATQLGVGATVAALLGGIYMVDRNEIINEIDVAQNYVGELISGSAITLRKPTAGEQSLIDNATKTAQDYVALNYQSQLKFRNAQAGWTMAQELVALHGKDPTADASALALMNDTHLEGTPCWPEYVADGTCHTPATSWALYALAVLALRAAPASLNALLDAQSPDGWWPLYFTLRDDRSYASTYATAWAVMAIDAQLDLATPQLQQKIAIARTRAIDWLISSENPQHRWKDYPYNSGGTVLDGVSALAVVALNQSPTDPRIAEVDRGWLTNLPMYTGRLDEIERSNVALGLSYKWDRTSYIVTPWIAASVESALRNGTTLGRANGRTYLDRFIDGLETFNPSADPSYFSSELVECLTAVSRGP